MTTLWWTPTFWTPSSVAAIWTTAFGVFLVLFIPEQLGQMLGGVCTAAGLLGFAIRALAYFAKVEGWDVDV